MSWESLLWSAPVRDPPVFPDLRIEEQGRIAEPVLGRTALAIAPVVLALALLTARGQAVGSVRGGSRLDRCPPANGRDVIGLGVRTAPDHVAFALGLGEIGHDPRIATGLSATALDVTGRVLRTATDPIDSIRDPLLVGEVIVTVRCHAIPLATRDRSRSRVRSLPSSDRSRSKKGGRRARRERREGVETVAVSEAPVVSEALAAVAPPVGGATVAALPSAVQDLARFFLSLAGSSSLGAVGGIAGEAAPASGVGAQLCPST